MSPCTALLLIRRQCASAYDLYLLGLHFLTPAAGVPSVSPVPSYLTKGKARPVCWLEDTPKVPLTKEREWRLPVLPFSLKESAGPPLYPLHFSPAAGTQEEQFSPQLWPCQSLL